MKKIPVQHVLEFSFTRLIVEDMLFHWNLLQGLYPSFMTGEPTGSVFHFPVMRLMVYERKSKG